MFIHSTVEVIWNGIAGPSSKYMLSFKRTYQIVFPSGCTIVDFYQEYVSYLYQHFVLYSYLAILIDIGSIS